MKVAEMIENIGYSKIDVIMYVPALGRVDFAFEIDHISEDDGSIYMEDANGHPLELKKDSEVTYEDGAYSIEKDNCTICIKLSE